MKEILRLPAILAIALSTCGVFAQNSAVQPVSKEGKWLERHESLTAQAQQGGIDLLFLGDSITYGWQTEGQAVWQERYAPRHAANFGIGGDRTQHILWRIQNGELDGIKPKVVVLKIGTNNRGQEKDTGKVRNTTPEVIEGVTAVVKALRAKLPNSKILLLAIFPRGEKGEPSREQLLVINSALAKLDNGKRVKFLDIGSKFLEPDGTLSKAIMPDLIHLSKKGYQIWADAMEPTLAAMLK